jgi:carbon storage regulator
MLVLSRKLGESIVINNNIVLTVVDIRGDKIRLGIQCPAAVSVHRQEVFDAIHGLAFPEPPPRPREEQPFVQAIQEAPDDVGTRLVFADWLEERGDPLGEYLRNQCRLAGLPRPPEWQELLVRQQALWREHGAVWRLSLPAALWSFR